MKIKEVRAVVWSGPRVAAVAVVVGFLLGCGGQPKIAAPPPEVRVARTQVRDVIVYAEFVGSTDAYQVRRDQAESGLESAEADLWRAVTNMPQGSLHSRRHWPSSRKV